VNGTFPMTVHLTDSDGSAFKVHETDHFNTTPTGAGVLLHPLPRLNLGSSATLAPGVAGPPYYSAAYC
jgi:hypothetical protein